MKMTDFKHFKSTKRKAAIWEALIAAMAMLRDEDLELLGLNMDTYQAIQEKRSDDDYRGVGTGFLAFAISASNLTDTDRIVCSQILSVASAEIAIKSIVTRENLDSRNVLTDETYWTQLTDWISGVFSSDAESALTALTGDSYAEEVESLVDYLEGYDSSRDLKSAGFIEFWDTSSSERTGE